MKDLLVPEVLGGPGNLPAPDVVAFPESSTTAYTCADTDAQAPIPTSGKYNPSRAMLVAHPS